MTGRLWVRKQEHSTLLLFFYATGKPECDDMRGARPTQTWLEEMLRMNLDLIRWLMSVGLLVKTVKCKSCRNQLKLIKSKSSIDGYVW